MSEKWFISDTHFGHRAILTYSSEKRQFNSLEEHDEYIIQEWNKLIRDDDKVFHCGDFCLNRSKLQVASRLRGRKILIMGNHDTFKTQEYLDAGFHAVKGCFQHENLICTHVPVHPNQLEHRFFANVHGHMHNHTINDWRYLNVSLEQTDLRPITLEEVYNRIMEHKESALNAKGFKYYVE